MRQYILAIMAISLIAMLGIPSAISFLPNFNNAQNITIKSWNYTVTQGANSFNERANFALLNISNITDTNPADIQIEGFSPLGTPLGLISFYLVSAIGNQDILLLSNMTNQSRTYNNATIYYNPRTTVNPIQKQPLLINYNCAKDPYSVGQTCGYVYTNSGTGKSIYFSVPDLQILNPKALPNQNGGFINETLGFFPLTYSNTPNGYISATFNTSSIVIIANRSLNSTPFSISFSTGALFNAGQNFILNSTNNKYSLKSTCFGACVLGSSIVYNSALPSQNANFLYNGINYDGLGFEAYLSVSSYNSMISEGLVANKNNVYNVLSSKPDNLNYVTPYSLNLSANISNSIRFTILPAFTRNIIVSNQVYTNNNPQGVNLETICNPICNTATFQYKGLVSNIIWSYTFPTQAFSMNIGKTYNITLGAANTSYLEVNIPHQVSFTGAGCDELYVDSNITYPTPDPIPYYPINISTQYCTLLIRNYSEGGYYDPSSIYIYGDPISPIDLENISIVKEWQFAKTSNGLIYDSNDPYILTLNKPLNSNSFITIGNVLIWRNARAYIGYNGLTNATVEGYDGSSSGSIGITTYTSPQQFLISDISIDGYSLKSIFSLNLAIYNNATQEGYPHIVVASSTNSLGRISVYYNYSGFTNISLSGITATLEKPYTTQYKLHGFVSTVCLSLSCLANATKPIVNVTPSPPPSSPMHLNISGTTTINFANLSTTTYLLDTNIGFPFYVLVIASLFLVFIGIMMLSSHSHGHLGFVFMLIAIWIFGIWEYEILYLGMIVTIFFLIYEYIEKRRK